MAIKLTPSDTLFFRDGKPFNMGDESTAESVFPPSPSVFYGALRTTYISENSTDIEQSITDSENMEIKGIFYFNDKHNDFYFPIPLDLHKLKDKKNNEPLHFFQKENELVSNTEVVSIFPNTHLLKPIYSEENDKIENAKGLIGLESFKTYLQGQSPEGIAYEEQESLFINEPKIGIGIDKYTNTSEESKLYKVSMQRNKDISFVVDFEGKALNGHSLLTKLGAEGKSVKIQNQAIDIPELPDDINDEFKLYLLTPTIFKKGWLPDWNINPISLIGEKDGVKIQITSVAIGKYLSLGGFDMQKGIPKKMYRAVPAGSVYYFKILNLNGKDLQTFLKDNFHYQSISDLEEHKKQGFGISFVGKI